MCGKMLEALVKANGEDDSILDTDSQKSVDSISTVYDDMFLKILHSEDTIGGKLKKIEDILRLYKTVVDGLRKHQAKMNDIHAVPDTGPKLKSEQTDLNESRNFLNAIRRDDRRSVRSSSSGALRENAVAKQESDVRSFVGQISRGRVVLPSDESRTSFLESILRR